MNLFIDIETIPTQRQDLKDEIRATIKPPGNYSKPESIQKWMDENAEAAFDEQWRKTGLDGAFGEVISIAWAIDDEDIAVFHRELCDTEYGFLGHVNARLSKIIGSRRPTWVGHNIINFDARFLWQRFLVNGIKSSLHIPHDEKPWSDAVFDTMARWCGARNTVSLDKLCKAFGLEAKTADGSQVWDMVKEGRYADLVAYNEDDVKKVRQLYKLMNQH